MSLYKIFDFHPGKAIEQYILGLKSGKLCCSNYILPFGTTKSVKSSKNFLIFFFFKLLIFSSQGRGDTRFYTRLGEQVQVTDIPILSILTTV